MTEEVKIHHDRAQIVANVRASFALEGIQPDEEMKALEQRYINGQIADANDLGELMRAHLRQIYNLK